MSLSNTRQVFFPLFPLLRDDEDDGRLTMCDQSESTLVEFRKNRRKNDGLQPHRGMGEYLMMYEGLVLYIKEMDEDRYQRLCSVSPFSDPVTWEPLIDPGLRITWQRPVNYIKPR